MSRSTSRWGNNGTFRHGAHASFVRRCVRLLQVNLYQQYLYIRNTFSRSSVLGHCNADVSLTSYGKRVQSAWITIETIGRGIGRPRRLILWLEDESLVLNPPRKLARLQRRGLEIKHCRDFGPHKKYYPYLLEGEPIRTLVTADDDMFYPRFWLVDLLEAHREDEVTAYRARIRTKGGYLTWPMCTTDQASDRIFATGVSGVAYPPRLLIALRARGDEFMHVCPRADDFWLHFAARSCSIPVRQVGSLHADWWPQRRVSRAGLWQGNAHGGDNDSISAAVAQAWGVAE